MNSIAFDVENEKRFSSKIQKFFRRYQVSSILKKCNAYSHLIYLQKARRAGTCVHALPCKAFF